MSNVLSQLDDRAQRDFTAERKSYRAILHRQDHPKPGDAEALGELMVTLKLTRQQVDDDAKKILRLQQARQNYAAADAKRPAPAEVEAANKARNDYFEESTKTMRKLENEFLALVGRNDEANRLQGLALQAQRDAGDLAAEAERIPDPVGVAGGVKATE